MGIVELGAFQDLRHAEQRVERRAQFVADIGDEQRFGLRARLGHVARGFGCVFLDLEVGDEAFIVVMEPDALVEQLRHRLAVARQHRGKQHDEHRGHDRVEPALQEQQHDERRQRETRMGEIGGTVRGARDEFRRRHAEEGEREIGLRRERAGHEPEHRANAPCRARDRRHECIAARPELGVAVGGAMPVRRRELLGGDDDGDLEEQRHEDQRGRPAFGEQRRDHAKSGEGEREIVPPERVQKIDAPRENRARPGFGCGTLFRTLTRSPARA